MNHMMIKKIHIKNFKSIVETKIDFSEKIYVIAGQNEAGKSSILEAINAFELDTIDKESLNYDEENNGNLKQLISITYTTNDNFFNELEIECDKLVDLEIKNTIPSFKLFNFDKLSRLKEFTLTKTIDFDDENQKEYKLVINDEAFQIIKSSINHLPNEKDDILTNVIRILKPIININDSKDKIIYEVWRCCPSIIFFNDVADILPDEIYIDDLIKNDSNHQGIKAVKNFQDILGIDFVEFSKKSPKLKKGSIENLNKIVTASFQNDWKQKIAGDNQVEICFDIVFDSTGKEKVLFYVKSKDGQYLEPRKRSKGLIWFLSLWLELKASENLNGIVFLFDEPGQNLHVKANNDMLEVFKNLSLNGHQIIYSTHSPSLIELDKLHNIGLVLNTEKEGTIVEGLTTSKLDSSYKRDALQPISEAMGLEPLKEFSILSKKNIIVEGLSDFWYYKAMSKILNRKNEYKFVPGIGVKSNKLFPLISFCIGYGLEWVLIMENGKNPENTKNVLLEHIFSDNEDEINKKVHIIGFKEVEDMFTLADIKLLDSKVNINVKKSPSEIIGSRKIIFSKKFFSLVENGSINKSDLSESTIINFEKVFDFIDKNLYQS